MLIEKHVTERQIDRHQGLNVLLDFLIDMFDIRHYYTPDGFVKNCIELHEKEPYLFKISHIWLDKVAAAIEKGTWIDFFGGIYEEMYQSKGKASSLGQFFTPPALCDLMSMVTGKDGTNRVNDAACGSGRTLLSQLAHSGFPRDSYYIGEDIDTTSVKMCALNLMIHGARGRVVRHDTLISPVAFDYGFELNEVRYPIPTPFYSLRKISHSVKTEPKMEPKMEPEVKKVVPKAGVQLDLFG